MWRVRGWWSEPGLPVVWRNARVVVRDRTAFMVFTCGDWLICRSMDAVWWFECGSGACIARLGAASARSGNRSPVCSNAISGALPG